MEVVEGEGARPRVEDGLRRWGSALDSHGLRDLGSDSGGVCVRLCV